MTAAINSDGQRLEVFGLTFREHHNLHMQQILRQYSPDRFQDGPPNRALLFTQLFDLAKELNAGHKEDQVERIQSWLKNGGEFPVPPPPQVISGPVEVGWGSEAQAIVEEDQLTDSFVGEYPDGHQQQSVETEVEDHEVDEVMEDQNGSDGEWPEYNPAEYETTNQYPGPNNHMDTEPTVTAESRNQSESLTGVIDGVENSPPTSTTNTAGPVADGLKDTIPSENLSFSNANDPTGMAGNISNSQQPPNTEPIVSDEDTESSSESDEELPTRLIGSRGGYRGRARGRGGNMYRNHRPPPPNPFGMGRRLDGAQPDEVVQLEEPAPINNHPRQRRMWRERGGHRYQNNRYPPPINPFNAGHRLDGLPPGGFVQPDHMLQDNVYPGGDDEWDGPGGVQQSQGVGHRLDGLQPDDIQAALHARREAQLRQVHQVQQTMLRNHQHRLQHRDDPDDDDMDDVDIRNPHLPPPHEIQGALPPVSEKPKKVDSTHIECHVCADTLPPDMFPPTSKITAHCEHRGTKACIPCIQHSIQSTLDEGSIHRLTCLFCHHLLSFDEIEKYATKTALARYKYLVLLDSPDIIMCLSPTCKAGQKHVDKETPKMICENCSFATCVLHKLPWHDNVTCAEFDSSEEQIERLEEAEATAKLLAKEQSQICPECHQGVFRSEGCDHMMCESLPSLNPSSHTYFY
jgi:hypothetical protein